MRDFEWPIGDKRMRTKRLSSVRSTATPASTLPTVRDISILVWGGIGSCGIDVSRKSRVKLQPSKKALYPISSKTENHGQLQLSFVLFSGLLSTTLCQTLR